MIRVYTNTNTYLLRFILLPLLVWLNYVPIHRLISGYYSEQTPKYIVYLGLAFFMTFLVLLILSFLGIYLIEIDKISNRISLSTPFKKVQIHATDIEGFYITNYANGWKRYEGLFLILKNGKTIEISEYNLDSLYDFNQYLIEQGIAYLGKKRSWFPITRKL